MIEYRTAILKWNKIELIQLAINRLIKRGISMTFQITQIKTKKRPKELIRILCNMLRILLGMSNHDAKHKKF